MQPITRETVVDRRQPAIRWSAVLAGTAVALGLWGVLQVLGLGAGLAALDPDDASSARGAALGAGVWSMIAPVVAMLVGGFVAARLSNTYDRRVAASHAIVMWGVAATAGLVFTMVMASHAGLGGARHGERMGGGMGRSEMMQSGMVSDAYIEARDVLIPINTRLQLEGKPLITPQQLVTAVRGAIDDGELDQKKLVKRLADATALSKDEAAAVAAELGSRADIIAARAARATPAEHDALNAAEVAGKSLLALGVAILLGIGTSILGAMIALRRYRSDDERRGREIRTGEVATGEVAAPREVQTTTPPYPPTTPGV